MIETLEEDLDPTAPTAERVAARAMVLSAVSCRGAIEKEADKPGAEELRKRILPWLEQIGVADELEPHESGLIATPLGQLDQRRSIDASWRSEGMAVLGWSLYSAELPPVYTQCDPAGTANFLGFLCGRECTPLRSPKMHDAAEIEMWADTYLTLHWRLRLLKSDPGQKDFVSCVRECKWGPLRLDLLEIKDDDVAIKGIRIDKLDLDTRQTIVSIVQERHTAFNWLLGFESVYSEVTVDT